MNPFKLFAPQVETVSLVKLKAPGLEPSVISASVRAIIKRHTTSDEATAEYGARTQTYSIHLDPTTLPADYATDPQKLLDLVIHTGSDLGYRIISASRGDDMTTGETCFFTCECQPYARGTL